MLSVCACVRETNCWREKCIWVHAPSSSVVVTGQCTYFVSLLCPRLISNLDPNERRGLCKVNVNFSPVSLFVILWIFNSRVSRICK